MQIQYRDAEDIARIVAPGSPYNGMSFMHAAVSYFFTQDKTVVDMLAKSEFSAEQVERHFHALKCRLQCGKRISRIPEVWGDLIEMDNATLQLALALQLASTGNATLANLPAPTILRQIKNGESEYRLVGNIRISHTANALMLAELWTDVMIAADHVDGIRLDNAILEKRRDPDGYSQAARSRLVLEHASNSMPAPAHRRYT